jgi:iduronate 2-sulfatase
VRKAALSLVNGHHSLRGEHWAYMRYRSGEEELYDMDQDPGQFDNLAKDPKVEDQRKEMRTLLDQRLAAATKK